jgi:hypothetical protein
LNHAPAERPSEKPKHKDQATSRVARGPRPGQDKTDLQVLSEDAIKFDILVKTMDAAMASGFPDLSLLDAGSAGL